MLFDDLLFQTCPCVLIECLSLHYFPLPQLLPHSNHRLGWLHLRQPLPLSQPQWWVINNFFVFIWNWWFLWWYRKLLFILLFVWQGPAGVPMEISEQVGMTPEIIQKVMSSFYLMRHLACADFRLKCFLIVAASRQSNNSHHREKEGMEQMCFNPRFLYSLIITF